MLTKMCVLLHGSPSAQGLETLLTVLGPICVLYLILYKVRQWWISTHPKNVLPFETPEAPDADTNSGRTDADRSHGEELRLAA